MLEHGVPQAKAEESRDVTTIAALGRLTERNNDARAMLLIQDGTRERLRDGIPQGGESPKGSDERAGRPR